MPLGEFELIRQFFDRGPARRALLGIGDDAALLAPVPAGSVIAVSTDMLIEGRHFFAGADPLRLGHKALAVNLSDLASMGAQPRAFTLALALPAVDEPWLAAFRQGLFALADRFDCELVGGDTTRGPLTISISIFGEVPAGAALRRDAAQPGDDVWVSGALGAAAWAVERRRQASGLGQSAVGDGDGDGDGTSGAHSAGGADCADLRLDCPEPRVALGLALRHLARAAIDVSDGLIADLGHILERSRVGAELRWPDVPQAAELAPLPEALRQRLALSGGDDYELLFTAAPENRIAVEALGRRLDLPLARIGAIAAGSGLAVLDARGRRLEIEHGGFDHFR
ncbi:MAG: thiamine-phosphate kinase [Burkholderiales bacterium]|nr:thiamine-phosphate kinase [Burkholderiales bacterium]